MNEAQTKRCRGCEAVKPVEEFHRCRQWRQSRCKACAKLCNARCGKCKSCAPRDPDREAVERNERARKEMYSLLHGTLRRLNSKKLQHSAELLGYSALELFEHITRHFKPGMSWTRRCDRHIDHVKPVAQFIREGVTDPKVINALSNLRPVWRLENLSKGSRYEAA